jgi:hypothetical protein
MQKVTPPAPSYDAVSDSDTKLIINLGIHYVILFRSMNCMKKVMLPASGGELVASDPVPRLNDKNESIVKMFWGHYFHTF